MVFYRNNYKKTEFLSRTYVNIKVKSKNYINFLIYNYRLS